jgi:hypothetical protein
MVALLALAWSFPVTDRDRPPADGPLLARYRSLGLPLPPPDAKLVRFELEGGGIIDGQFQPRLFALAFVVKPETRTEYPLLLSGIHQWQPVRSLHAEEVKPGADVADSLYVDSEGTLALALQCEARGWKRLARRLYEQSRKEAKVPANKILLSLAWEYYEGLLTDPDIDRAPVARRLKDLMRLDKERDTDSNRRLIQSLELALVRSKARPGSVEALIDDLVNYSQEYSVAMPYPEDRYWRIANRGFEAVPALIEHLDDDRLTRTLESGFMNVPSWYLRVGDVASDLLENLAGEDIAKSWQGRHEGYRLSKADAREWWEEAREIGEEQYLLERVLVPKAPGRDRFGVDGYLLSVILAKYPRHIPSLYRTVLDDYPYMGTFDLAEAVLRCPIPVDEKRDLFLHAVQHEDPSHVLPALHALKNLDKERFAELAIAKIEAIPRDVPGPYWECPEQNFAALAMDCEDPRVWLVLARVARRSSVGLRMELLGAFWDPKDPRHWRERLRLLAGFLDDATVRVSDSKGKYFGPHEASEYPRIEVRDFAALEIARLLGIETERNPGRTPNEWAELRSQVRKAVDRELARPEPRDDE